MNLWSSSGEWLERAIGTYQRPLTRYSRNLVKNLESAKDVVQEAYLRLWKNGPIEFESPIRIWLYKTTRNLAIDHLRKEGRMNPTREEDQIELCCPESLPSEQLEFRQLAERLTPLIEGLPQKHQEVLRLKFQEDLSYSEISQITGHSVSHVGVLLHQAVMHLRDRVQEGAL